MPNTASVAKSNALAKLVHHDRLAQVLPPPTGCFAYSSDRLVLGVLLLELLAELAHEDEEVLAHILLVGIPAREVRLGAPSLRVPEPLLKYTMRIITPRTSSAMLSTEGKRDLWWSKLAMVGSSLCLSCGITNRGVSYLRRVQHLTPRRPPYFRPAVSSSPFLLG